jgi:hypothetical protein
MKKFNDLNEVLDFLDEIPRINAGGCGISALSVYKWLKANDKLSEDFAILYLHYWEESDYETNSKFIKGTTDRAVACSHAIFRYNGKTYDSSGRVKPRMGIVGHVEITPEHIERFMKASLASEDWNPAFSRAAYVPYIETALGIDLTLT